VLEPPTMPPAPVTALDPRATCRACGQPLPAAGAVCAACGAAHGAANRCPHCRAIADVEPHAALGFRCLVCGGPRVALNVSGVEPSASTLGHLARAAKQQTEHVMYSAAGFVLTAMGGLALLIATLVVAAASPSLASALAIYLGALVPTGAGAFSLARAARARTLRGEALHAAQVGALCDVQAVTGVLDAQRVAEILRLSPERAELLAAEASVATLLETAPPPRLRVSSAAATEPGGAPFGENENESENQPARADAQRTGRGDTEI
jgi:hypothetical protein